MAGCNNPGGCACAARRAEAAPRESLTEALAQVIVDSRVVKFALEYSRNFPMASVDEIIRATNTAKIEGKL